MTSCSAVQSGLVLEALRDYDSRAFDDWNDQECVQILSNIRNAASGTRPVFIGGRRGNARNYARLRGGNTWVHGTRTMGGWESSRGIRTVPGGMGRLNYYGDLHLRSSLGVPSRLEQS